MREEVTDALAHHLDLLRDLRDEQRRAIAEMAAGSQDAIANAVLLTRDIVKSGRGIEWLGEILARYGGKSTNLVAMHLHRRPSSPILGLGGSVPSYSPPAFQRLLAGSNRVADMVA